MSSMWTAVSDLDYYDQFNPEPPEKEPNDPQEAAAPELEELEPVWAEADRQSPPEPEVPNA